MKEFASYRAEKAQEAGAITSTAHDNEKEPQTTMEFPKSQWGLEAAKIAERMRR